MSPASTLIRREIASIDVFCVVVVLHCANRLYSANIFKPALPLLNYDSSISRKDLITILLPKNVRGFARIVIVEW